MGQWVTVWELGTLGGSKNTCGVTRLLRFVLQPLVLNFNFKFIASLRRSLYISLIFWRKHKPAVCRKYDYFSTDCP